MSVMVRVPFGMAWCAGGQEAVEAEGSTLAEVWKDLHAAYPELMWRVSKEQGSPSDFVRIAIDGGKVESFDNLDIPVRDGAYIELGIITASAAGGNL